MAKNNKGFVFHPEFLKAIESLDSEVQQLALYEAIINYGLDFTEPHITGKANEEWQKIKPIMDKDFENSNK